jgi:ATP-binding cassette subfamily F protein 3
MVLTIENLSISIGKKELLIDESVGIGEGAKVGIIGRNGVGKTTLLKAILGQIDYAGKIKYHGKAVYFSQHIDLDLTKKVSEILGQTAVVHHQSQHEKKIQEMEALLAKPEVYENATKLSQLMEQYLTLQAEAEKHKTGKPNSKLKQVLKLLEIKDSWLEHNVGALSTGQRAIVALAQILSSDAELLLLDEPTNHLDFKRLEILEDYLKNFKGTVLMVTHDRYFLNKVCDTILKIEKGKLLKYIGNYSAYLKTSEAEFEAQKKAYELEQEYIANEKDKIARIGKSPLKVSQGKYREKLLAKREIVEMPDLDKSRFTTYLEAKQIHANVVLDIEDLSVGYKKDKPLLSHINLKINVGEKVVLIGENGIGKSTLFKTIEGRLPALSGKVMLHSQGKLGYVDQELKDLTNEGTLYDEIYSKLQDNAKTRQQLSLGGFVQEEEVFKPIAQLSLGEKARLNMIKVFIEKPNILLLDEPTNHLDLDACEIIEKAFLAYEGAILAVSHDRYFIEKIAQRIIRVTDGTIKDVPRKQE